MNVHNITEDLVFSAVTEICDTIEKEGSKAGYCTCEYCRLDTACYVLNRMTPNYIVSSRGAARAGQTDIAHQQTVADIGALIHEGLKRVNHNQRPNRSHEAERGGARHGPVFNMPTIVGRIFNGQNFEPLTDVEVELRRNGAPVPMKDRNWQNPYHLEVNTKGLFTFWPAPIPAKEADAKGAFEFLVTVEFPGLETLNHIFTISGISEDTSTDTFSMARACRIPDLYMFPPGGDGYDDSSL